MNLKNYYWLFEKIIPEHVCDEIVRFAKSSDSKQAVTGDFANDPKLTKDRLKKLKKTRDSHVVWLSENWIWNLIIPLVRRANISAGWNFQWEICESSQFTLYNKNQHYGWHVDEWGRPYDMPGDARHNNIRKLSSMLMLSNGSEFEGGEFEIDTRNGEARNDKSKILTINYDTKGTVVVFPSFLWHRVKPVKKGIRYSMPTWHLGRPFQ